ncbi:NDP-hexose 2,3-dehydratase family protein [Actinomadura geliboluensis]|uniref:NDP-hexose 2,3-dehydratase family protein n=1 Tax=Actinomadura geliboluensis TaxID=882440 RepID=UPI0036BEEAA2
MSPAIAPWEDDHTLDGAAKFTLSASIDHQAGPSSAFRKWWDGRHRDGRFEVTRIPFREMDSWHFAPDTGNLRHASGRFFTVEGLRVSEGGAELWSQPILHQPEIGILGILAKEFDGVLHFLMQAKMEPGNVNAVQLSPTVQATRSNYSRVHRGARTRYLEYFLAPRRGSRVLVDVLQSEQGAWFLGKRNRNMVVQALGNVPDHDDFHWVTIGELRALLAHDNLVSMDARTVLASIPFTAPRPGDHLAAHRAGPDEAFTGALLRSYAAGGSGALHSRREVLSWFTEMKAACHWRVDLVPLNGVAGWARSADEIADDGRGGFRILATRVRAGNREVATWSQPLLAPRGHAAAAFVARSFGGVLHLLVQARPQPGLRDLVELAPTVYVPPCADPAAAAAALPFGAEAMTADPARVRFDTLLSEEGGRFYHAQTRYRVVEAGDGFPARVPENYRWLTVRQLMELVQHGHYLDIEARSLLACVHSLW